MWREKKIGNVETQFQPTVSSVYEIGNLHLLSRSCPFFLCTKFSFVLRLEFAKSIMECLLIS